MLPHVSFSLRCSDAADLMKGMLSGDRAVIRCRHHLTQRLGDHIACAINAPARRLAVGIHDHVAFFIEHIEPLQNADGRVPSWWT